MRKKEERKKERVPIKINRKLNQYPEIIKIIS